MLNEMLLDSLIHEILGSVYAHLALEVGLRDVKTFFHIYNLYIENFCLKPSASQEKSSLKISAH